MTNNEQVYLAAKALAECFVLMGDDDEAESMIDYSTEKLITIRVLLGLPVPEEYNSSVKAYFRAIRSDFSHKACCPSCWEEEHSGHPGWCQRDGE